MNESTCCDEQEDSKVTREDVRDFYSKAALEAQDNLCCPAEYDASNLSHIPEEVREISYGCGSPVDRAGLRQGETMVDLGSGGGIDCFIASKLVGASGRVIGVDMTEEMLKKATSNAEKVAKNLGYGNVEFKQGFLEKIPVEDDAANLVTSNCVLNLSVSKADVFKEIKRILKPGGRFVISDIISDRAAPQHMRNNRELWGECASGAMTLKEFIDMTRAIGFHGISLKKDYLWKIIEGIKFYSYTLTAYAPNHGESSCCSSLTAAYNGPFESIVCNGQEFRVGEDVEIDEETAKILGSAPYTGQFTITDPETEAPSDGDSCCN